MRSTNCIALRPAIISNWSDGKTQLSKDEQAAKDAIGLPALKAWDEAHKDFIVYQGGPLGPTKRVSESGVADVVNEMTVFVVVRAESHEAAARLFEGHPHMTIFPCDAVDVMPLLGGGEVGVVFHRSSRRKSGPRNGEATRTNLKLQAGTRFMAGPGSRLSSGRAGAGAGVGRRDERGWGGVAHNKISAKALKFLAKINSGFGVRPPPWLNS